MLTTSAMLIGVTIVAVAVAVAVACAKELDEKAISANAATANLVPFFIFWIVLND
jgi:ABC-type polysaccharide transport system permease subunit